MLDYVPGIVALYDVKSGTYSYVSDAIDKILGYAPTEFLQEGATLAVPFLHPDDALSVQQKIQAFADKATQTSTAFNRQRTATGLEFRMRHASGKWVWLHAEANVYDQATDGSVEQLILIMIDITERKKTEQQLLLESEQLEASVEQHTERLELALEASQMGTWEWNVETGALIWSPEMMKLYGIDPKKGEITIEKFFAALHPDDRAMKQKVLEHAAQTGESYQVEHRCVWPDGSVHWILGRGKAFMKNGQAYRMIGTAMNVDERKTTEAALEASQLRYKTLFDSTLLGIATADFTGRIYEANDKWLAIMGYTEKDLTKSTLDLTKMTPSEYEPIDAQKLEDLKLKGEARPWEKEYFRKDKSRVPVLTGVVSIPKTADLCLVVVLDISERQRLIALNKAKDEFISIASHQLRTPATIVKQYTSMLIGNYAGKLTPEQLKFAEAVYDSNERQLKIVDDLLHVARIDTGTIKLSKKTTDLVKLVESAIKGQQISTKPRKQKTTFKHPTGPVSVRMDGGMMVMAIENLLDNASKYSLNGTQITVTLRQDPRYVSVDIKDQGVGIDKKDLGKLYLKFSRLDNPLSISAGGNGLGLYWVKRVVEAHGGSIDVTSKLKKGTTFTLKLPCVQKV